MAQAACAAVPVTQDEEAASTTCAEDEPTTAIAKAPTTSPSALACGVRRAAALAAMALAAAAVLAVAAVASSGSRGQRSSGDGQVQLAGNVYLPWPENDCSAMFPGRERWRGVVADRAACEAQCEADKECNLYAFQANACDEDWFQAGACIHYTGQCQHRHTTCYALYQKIEKTPAEQIGQ